MKHIRIYESAYLQEWRVYEKQQYEGMKTHEKHVSMKIHETLSYESTRTLSV